MDWISGASPRSLARIAGALYLVNIVGGAIAIGFVPAALIVDGDPSATAHNIVANELLYRSAVAAHLIVTVTNVPLAVIFYELFKVVNRRVALLVVFFTLVGTAVESASLLNQFTTLAVLNGAHYSSALTSQQLQALAYLPLALPAYDISTVFFGFNAIALGYLVFRSTFLPRVIGGLLVIDGLSYLVYSFADIVSPAFAEHLVPWIQLPILPAEGSLCVWFLIAGVNVQRWSERAEATLIPGLVPRGG
jgi:hypothetical protein